MRSESYEPRLREGVACSTFSEQQQHSQRLVRSGLKFSSPDGAEPC